MAKHVQMSNDVGAEDLLRQLIRTLYDIYDKHVEFCCGMGVNLGFQIQMHHS